MIHRYEFLLALAALLFSMGLLGVMIRRNLLVVIMSLELMPVSYTHLDVYKRQAPTRWASSSAGSTPTLLSLIHI